MVKSGVVPQLEQLAAEFHSDADHPCEIVILMCHSSDTEPEECETRLKEYFDSTLRVKGHPRACL
jgi:hypothetical protein